MYRARFLNSPDSGRIFVTTTSAESESSDSPGVIFCHALVGERQTTYRATHLCAKILAESGVPSIRFDYFGTGESAGDLPQASVDGMLSDALFVANHAKELIGVDRVIFLGIRFGAVIAIRAASTCAISDSCILWNPTLLGTPHLRELIRIEKIIELSGPSATRDAHHAASLTDGVVLEADMMTRNMMEQIEAVDIANESIALRRCLITGCKHDKKERRQIDNFMEHQKRNIESIDYSPSQGNEYWSSSSMYDASFPTQTFETTKLWIRQIMEN